MTGPADAARLPEMDQIGRRGDRNASAPQLAPRTWSPAAAQVSNVKREPIPTSGASAGSRDVRAAPQLSRGPATAAAPDALSSPAQGRRQSLERLAGRDRCDPQTNRATADSCAQVIETRAAEFVRADPLVLSPEQRLLIDQRLREAPNTTQTAVQRIAKNDVDADSMDAQGLASLTLTQRPEAVVDTAPTTDAEAAATSLVQAIIEGARSLNPPR